MEDKETQLEIVLRTLADNERIRRETVRTALVVDNLKILAESEGDSVIDLSAIYAELAIAYAIRADEAPRGSSERAITNQLSEYYKTKSSYFTKE